MSEASTGATLLPRTMVGYAPATFLERGVVVPFTSPALAGARIRPGVRDGMEIIVGNPSGGRGVYILPYLGAFALCSPTVHDRKLLKHLEDLPAITPLAVRQLSLEIAESGLAGRALAAAAQSSRAADLAMKTVANYELVVVLERQMFPDVAAARGGGIEINLKRAIAEVAGRLQLSDEEVPLLLEELAAVFAPLGVGADAELARIPRGVAALRDLRTGLTDCLRGPPPIRSLEADLVLATTDLTIACTRTTVKQALAFLLDLPELLRLWIADASSIRAIAARPDWLLDGWERINLVWQQGGRDLESLFAELADLVPATPREVSGWIGSHVESAPGIMRTSRNVPLNEDWRTGVSILDIVARNEKLRTAALRTTV